MNSVARALALTSPSMIGSQSQVSNENGSYRFPAVPPGTYELTFELAGFNTVKRGGVQISLGFTANVNAELAVATLQETVTVTGALASPLVMLPLLLVPLVLGLGILQHRLFDIELVLRRWAALGVMVVLLALFGGGVVLLADRLGADGLGTSPLGTGALVVSSVAMGSLLRDRACDPSFPRRARRRRSRDIDALEQVLHAELDDDPGRFARLRTDWLDEELRPGRPGPRVRFERDFRSPARVSVDVGARVVPEPRFRADD